MVGMNKKTGEKQNGDSESVENTAVHKSDSVHPLHVEPPKGGS